MDVFYEFHRAMHPTPIPSCEEGSDAKLQASKIASQCRHWTCEIGNREFCITIIFETAAAF